MKTVLQYIAVLLFMAALLLGILWTATGPDADQPENIFQQEQR